MRLVVTIFALCIYVLFFNWYIYALTDGNYTIRCAKLIYSCSTLFIALFYKINQMIKGMSQINEQLNEVCFWALICNFIFILLTHACILTKEEPQKMFYAFNGSVFALTIIILISMRRHGFLK